MDREREIIHKILDGDAEEEEQKVLSRGMETDTRLKEDFTGLMNAVRLLKESERREAPFSFTAEVMKKLAARDRRPCSAVSGNSCLAAGCCAGTWRRRWQRRSSYWSWS